MNGNFKVGNQIKVINPEQTYNLYEEIVRKNSGLHYKKFASGYTPTKGENGVIIAVVGHPYQHDTLAIIATKKHVYAISVDGIENLQPKKIKLDNKKVEKTVKVELMLDGKSVLSTEYPYDSKLETTIFDWSAFKSGKFAVHCDTEEKASEFLKECDVQGIKWCTGHRPITEQKETRWDMYERRTCYSCDSSGGLTYGTGDSKIKIDYTPSKPTVKEVSRKAKVGEYVKITKGDCHYAEVDKIYIVDDVDEDGWINVKAESGSSQLVRDDQYIVLEGYVPEDKPAYTEVHHPAKVGEWIKVVNEDAIIPKTNGVSDYKKGDILKVIDVEYDGVARYKENANDGPYNHVILQSEYVVLENYHPEEPKPMPSKEEPKVDTTPKPFVKAKVGDKIKVIKDTEKHGPSINIGDIHTVTKIGRDWVESDENVFYDKDQEYIILDSTQESPSNKPLSAYTREELITELFNRQPK